MKRLNIVNRNNHKILSVHSGICMCKYLVIKKTHSKDGKKKWQGIS